MSLTDKNSPKTSNASTSTTITKTDNRVVSGAAGGSTSVGGNTDLSNISTGFGGSVNVTTTDQGAIAAGLQTALAGIDAANTTSQTAIQAAYDSSNKSQATNANLASDLTSQAVGVAQSVAQGQQNTTIKYVMYIFLGIAAAVAIYAISTKKG